MTVTVTIHKKSERVLLDLGQHDRRFSRGIKEALHDIGGITQAEIRRLLKVGPKTGRIYKRTGRPNHQASAPGQAPATDTGALLKSVDYKVRGSIQMEVGDQEPYGVYLENGTRKMKPRPHIVVAANLTAAQALERLEQCVADELGVK